ncbi:MAG: histidine kinase [Agriterribacter sp.]
MKYISIITICFFLQPLSGLSQYALDTIDPLFNQLLNSGRITESYAFSKNATILFSNDHSNRATTISIQIFSSNSLQITGQPAYMKIPELKRIKLDSTLITVQNLSENMQAPLNGYWGNYAVPVFDSTEVIVTVGGVDHENAGDYEFSVWENNSKQVVSWRDIHLFCKSYISTYKANGQLTTEMAYIGAFKTGFGNALSITVRQKKDKKIAGSISAYWLNRGPIVMSAFSTDELADILTYFRSKSFSDVFQPVEGTELSKELRPKDSLLIKRAHFAAGKNSLMFYLDDKVRTKELIEYNIISDGDSSGWKVNNFDVNMIWLKNLPPGKHRLLIRYSFQPQQVCSYPFSIDYIWYQTVAFKIAVGLLGLVLLGFIYLLCLSRKQKQNLLKEQMQNQHTQNALKSIRSQFNPHFVFNALNSIQGLITKNDIEASNRYLSEFSSLMRDSLKESDKEYISVATEIKMLESYLQLEKLRFGFNYSITTDEGIDIHATEVPALLLQPLIENAIKHGIAALYSKGTLSIRFIKSGNDMQAFIADNGKGFDANNPFTGFGLKLTKERIDLLNNILKDQSIEISFTKTAEGMTVSLLFKNWLT